MFDFEIEDWEQESGLYLQKGKKIRNINDNSQYQIERIAKDSISLKPIPFFKNQSGQSFEISYEELINAFDSGILLIEGFQTGQLRELKIAISSVKKKIINAEHLAIVAEKQRELEELRIKEEQKNKENLEAQQEKQKRIEEANEMEEKLMEIEIMLNE